MTQRGKTIAALILLAIVTWECLASLSFLWLLDLWNAYPWPDKLWMWVRYFLDGTPNRLVHRWLPISGIIAALPIVVIVLAKVQRHFDGRRTNQGELYGKSDFAGRQDMREGGINTTKRPF